MRHRLLSHRGCWTHGLAKNSAPALARSFAAGYGVETDVRDCAGALLISHDAPRPPLMTLQELLALASAGAPGRPTLALNIKADGLADMLAPLLRPHAQLDCFVFDMAVPDMRAYFAAGIPVFARLSEVEPVPAWLDRCAGVWLDAFETEWYGMADIEALLEQGKRVCVVSPELHGRAHRALWSALKPVAHHPRFLLCTDHPDVALEFFGG